MFRAELLGVVCMVVALAINAGIVIPVVVLSRRRSSAVPYATGQPPAYGPHGQSWVPNAGAHQYPHQPYYSDPSGGHDPSRGQGGAWSHGLGTAGEQGGSSGWSGNDSSGSSGSSGSSSSDSGSSGSSSSGS